MSPGIGQGQSKPRPRHVGPEGRSREGSDNDLSDPKVSTSYQWGDLLKPNLPPTDFDAVLSGVLRSPTEMEKIDEGELQSVIDVLGQWMETKDVMDGLGKRCFLSLRDICASRGVLPTLYTMNPVNLQRPGQAVDRGGYGDVWKGDYKGRAVAIKALRNDEERKKIFCCEVIMWKRLSHPNTLPFLGAYINALELVMVSPWMEDGNIREYLLSKPHVNRLSLLVDIAQGVVYLHDMGVVHGDLKGLNILVKDNGRACLADFGFMSIALDPGTTSVTLSAGEKAKGTYPWMSPELFDPTIFDLPKCRLTKESDCYALGMVIYEVLSGRTPFEGIKKWEVPTEVIAGKRPGIPEHSSSMKGPWNLARGCWDHFPRKRPNSRTILDRLQEAFMNTGGITHITSREPGPMLAQGQPAETITDMTLVPVDVSGFYKFNVGVGTRLKRALLAVRAMIKLSGKKSRLP
ncbi:kinase-like domain-containing protein [Thelephora terrestris]|uniref:Kinase-like domain-containing protein n=1 Tax=Thelephora terrestris TaxID=56493 RepID=A0A9P6LA81_9AGAM|nr:kinase-like domain-containing protein [Thelephora terrestris]